MNVLICKGKWSCWYSILVSALSLFSRRTILCCMLLSLAMLQKVVNSCLFPGIINNPQFLKSLIKLLESAVRHPMHTYINIFISPLRTHRSLKMDCIRIILLVTKLHRQKYILHVYVLTIHTRDGPYLYYRPWSSTSNQLIDKTSRSVKR